MWPRQSRLRGIVHHVHPLRQNARPDAVLELARNVRRSRPGSAIGLRVIFEIVAQQLPEQLRGRSRLKQHRTVVGFADRSLRQRGDMFGHLP